MSVGDQIGNGILIWNPRQTCRQQQQERQEGCDEKRGRREGMRKKRSAFFAADAASDAGT